MSLSLGQHDYPLSWARKRLRFAALLNPSKTECALPAETEVSFLPMEAIGERGELDLARSRPVGELSGGFTYFREGDVVVAKITPCFENGKGALVIGLENQIGFGTTELHVLRPRDGVFGRFLYYATTSHPFRIMGKSSMYGAAGQQRIGDAFLRDFLLGFPSLQQQRRIADFVDRKTAVVDELIAKKERLVGLLAEKRQALITQAVTKGLDPNVPMKDSGVEWLSLVPLHWQVQQLRHRITGIEQGWSPSCESREANEDEWGVLKVGCVNYGAFTPSENKALPPTLEPIPALEVRSGDVLVSRANTRELVGSAVLVNETRPRLMLCDKLFRVSYRGADADPRFLALLLQSGICRAQFERDATGASGSMQNIGQDSVRKLVFAWPSIVEQHAISRYVDERTAELRRVETTTRVSLDCLREYRQALITAAVTGQLDVTQAASSTEILHRVEADVA